jgi:prepilin-type N-terminal cleavage/methylation domain-containing protein
LAGTFHHTRSSFTLVEVLVALTVASVGLLAVFTALRMAGATASLVHNQEQAQRLAERHMTDLLAAPIKQMGNQKGQEGIFAWEAVTRAAKDADLAEVVVTVRWLHQGRTMRFQLVSLRPVAGSGS